MEAPRCQGLAQRLGRHPSAEPVSLVAEVEVVLAQEPIEMLLDLGPLLAPALASFDQEALVEQRPVHVVDEAVGLRRADPGGVARLL